MKLHQSIHVERDDSGDYLITWTDDFTQGPVTIYASTRPDSTTRGDLLHNGNGAPADKKLQQVKLHQLRVPKRHYFHLVTQNGTGVTVGERRLPLHSGTNFRDFGGYLTEDGRQVQWGKLYRSGHLSFLSAEDQSYLTSLAISKNCDFRLPHEREKEPNKLGNTTKVIGLTIDAGSFSSFFKTLREDQLTREFMIEHILKTNRELVQAHQHRFRDMFAELLSLDDGAFLINCSAGKDRTGFASALILSALGVPRETILDDYRLSSRYFDADKERSRAEEKYGPEIIKIMFHDAVMAIAEARDEYLQAAFDTIDAEYGSLEHYLEQAYSVGQAERQLLRERFTV